MTNKERYHPTITRNTTFAPVSLGTPGYLHPVDYTVFKKTNAEKAKLATMKANCENKGKLKRYAVFTT